MLTWLNGLIKGGTVNRVRTKYLLARKHYGEKLPQYKQNELKDSVKRRLGLVPAKPRVRYKLTTVVTKYCGYRYVEWK